MLPIQETINKLGAAEIAAESGFPLTTICRWRDGDRIPGKGRAHEWRVNEFEAAVARIEERRKATEEAALDQPEAGAAQLRKDAA